MIKKKRDREKYRERVLLESGEREKDLGVGRKRVNYEKKESIKGK